MSDRYTDRVIPAPAIDPDNQSFWDAARQGRLLIGRCLDTGRPFFYPRGVSPFTLSSNVGLEEASGIGTIYSFSVARTKEPYVIAYVELAEGPRMITNIVDFGDVARLRIGLPVRVVFKPTAGDGPPVPMFRPT